MHMPGFWHANGNRLLRGLLAPLGWLYGRATLARLARKGWRAPVPVISIGNFTAGGAGKTPTAIALVRALQARGMNPFVLSRGYGGSETGPLRVDLAQHVASQVGDEPLLIARSCPVIVARKRADGARLALAQGADCLVMDDALQNPDLEKDFSLAVIDGGFGVGNGACVPAGPLRAPLEAMRSHVSAALVIGADEQGVAAQLAPIPVYSSRMQPDASTDGLKDQPVIAYCGIGRPEKFFATLREIGADVVAQHAFGDHHPFSEEEARALLAEAQAKGARLVTTEKDRMRLNGSEALNALAEASIIVPIRLSIPPDVLEMIYLACDSRRSRSSTASGLE